MGSRTKARECALQALYQLDTSGGTPSDVLAGLWAHFEPADEDTKAFAEALVRGAQREQAAIDQLIQHTSTNWKLERPLTGLAGLVDWRLSGRLSRLIRAGLVIGAAGEALLTPPGMRLAFKK